MGLFLFAHIPPSPSLIHSSHGFNHPTIDSQLLGPCQTPRPRRVGDLGSVGVGFWGVPFSIGMHIKVLAQLRATLQKSNVLSTLCPLFIGEDSSIVLQTRSSSLQDPPTQTDCLQLSYPPQPVSWASTNQPPGTSCVPDAHPTAILRPLRPRPAVVTSATTARPWTHRRQPAPVSIA